MRKMGVLFRFLGEFGLILPGFSQHGNDDKSEQEFSEIANAPQFKFCFIFFNIIKQWRGNDVRKRLGLHASKPTVRIVLCAFLSVHASDNLFQPFRYRPASSRETADHDRSVREAPPNRSVPQEIFSYTAQDRFFLEVSVYPMGSLFSNRRNGWAIARFRFMMRLAVRRIFAGEAIHTFLNEKEAEFKSFDPDL